MHEGRLAERRRHFLDAMLRRRREDGRRFLPVEKRRLLISVAAAAAVIPVKRSAPVVSTLVGLQQPPVEP